MSRILAHPADVEFVESTGLLFEGDAMSRGGGRMVALLLLAPNPLTLEEIADELLLSKASVSSHARQMERWGILERVAHPGDRRDFYQVADDFGIRLLERRLDQMRQVRRVLARGREAPAATDARVALRFQVLERLNVSAIDSLDGALRAFREGGHPEAAPDGVAEITL